MNLILLDLLWDVMQDLVMNNDASVSVKRKKKLLEH
jgi:hypothetical protein